MCVATRRPLALDEVLEFDLHLADAGSVDGRARVLRQAGYGAYAMRFEALVEASRERLEGLAAASRLG